MEGRVESSYLSPVRPVESPWVYRKLLAMNQNPLRCLDQLLTTTTFPRERPDLNRSHALGISIVHSGCRWVEPRDVEQHRIPTWHLTWCPQTETVWTANGIRLVTDPGHLLGFTPGTDLHNRIGAPALMWYCCFLLGGGFDQPQPRAFRLRLDAEGARLLADHARLLAQRGPVTPSERFLAVGLISWALRQVDPSLWSLGWPDQTISELCATIDAAEGRWHSNRELAATCDLSLSHFISRFRVATGRTPQDYQRRARLARAAYLLLTGDPPLRYLAQRLGFTDRSHFSRSFARSHGLAPGRWRRMNLIVA